MVVMSSSLINEQAERGASQQRVGSLLDAALASRLAAQPPSEREKLNEEHKRLVVQSKTRMLQVGILLSVMCHAMTTTDSASA